MTDDRLMGLLRELVAIPSVSPEDCDDSSVTGELKVAEFLAAYLESRDFELEWQDRESDRPNLLGAFGPRDARKTILLEAHMDTVGVAGMSRPPFTAHIENGRLYARGACDTKGSMAAALHALRPDVLRAVAEAGVRIVFAGVMGEEKGNIGAERMVERGVHADQAIILEPTELAIVHAHKGALWFEVETRGRAGHGSDPARGVNAITAMSALVGELQSQIAEDRARLHNALLGHPTLSVGSIHGGMSVNIVPDRCVMSVDRRMVPGENPDAIIERVRRFLDQTKGEGRLLSYDIRLIKMGVPFETSSDSELVKTLKSSCEDEGMTPKTEGAAWYSDAGALSATCREIVVFGPGSIKQAHTADEFIALDELERGSRILGHFLRRSAAV